MRPIKIEDNLSNEAMMLVGSKVLHKLKGGFNDEFLSHVRSLKNKVATVVDLTDVCGESRARIRYCDGREWNCRLESLSLAPK